MERADRTETDETKVTPEMIEAGVQALAQCDTRVFGPEGIVEEVFLAMKRASH